MFCWTLQRMFFVCEKLEVYDELEDGATVFAIVKTHSSLKVLILEAKRQMWENLLLKSVNKLISISLVC